MKTVELRNTTHRLVVLPLNSGKNLFLYPRAKASEVAESEIEGNARAEKLRRANVIQCPAKPAAPKSRAKTSASKKRASKTTTTKKRAASAKAAAKTTSD